MHASPLWPLRPRRPGQGTSAHGRSRAAEHRCPPACRARGARPRHEVRQEAMMARPEKDAYVALLAACDPTIRALVEQGFEFVTNAFKAGAAPPGLKAPTDQD